MRRFLVFTILLALFLTVFTPLALSAAYDGMVEVKYEETSVNNVFKMVIYAKSNLGVKAIDVILSYDNTVVVPVKRADNTPLTILDEGKNKEPVKIVALDANGDIYSSPQALWKVHGTRTASRIGAFIDDSSLVVLTNELMPVYEIYYTFQTGKSTADFSKSTFKVESAWGTSADDSFLMDFFNASPGDLASEAPFDRAGLAILRSDDTRIYWKQVNGTLSQIDVTYTYPNSLVATLGSITLQAAGSVTSVDIPANGITVPNTLQIEAKTFDTGEEPYELTSAGTWELKSAPSGVTLVPQTDNMFAKLIVPADVEPGNAQVTFSSEAVSKTMDITIQRSTSVPARAEFHKDTTILNPDITDFLSIPSPGSPDLVQAYQVKVFDQYNILISSPSVDWSQSGGTNITHSAGSDGTIANVQVANGALPGTYVLRAKIDTVEAVQPIKSTRSLETYSTITLSAIQDKTYNGLEQVPTLEIKDGSTPLTEVQDYFVEYTNNIDKGTANVTITGKGNYSGTLSSTFEIQPKSLGDDGISVEAIDPQTYRKSALTPSILIRNTTLDQLLEMGTDYTVEYSNNVNAGTATVTTTGIGNYSGTLTTTFIIKPKTINVTAEAKSKVFGSSDETLTYSVEPSLLTGDTFSGSLARAVGENVGQYEISQNTLSAGTNYTINFTKANYTITTKSVADADIAIEAIANQTFNGLVITPSPKVTNQVLTQDLGVNDFDYSYDNNINATTTAKVTITGKGNYSGAKSVNFTILPLPISDNLITITNITDKPYTGSSIEVVPEITNSNLGPKLGLGTDFSTSYSNNLDVGTATITIQGLENYTGTTTKTFNIIKSTYVPTIKYSIYVVSNKAATYEFDLASRISQIPGFKEVNYGTPTDASTDSLFSASSTVVPSGVTDACLVSYHVNSAVAGKTGTITIPLSSKNYNDTSAEIEIIVTDVNPDWSTIDPYFIGDNKVPYTYGDKNSKAVIPTAGTAHDAMNNLLDGVFSYKDPNAVQRAGSKTITVQFTVTSDSYRDTVIEKSYTVTIQPKQITVTADDLSRPYGEENPTLTYTYDATALVFTTDKTDFEAAVGIACDAVAGTSVTDSPVDIIVTDKGTNSDYAIIPQNGSLMITKAIIKEIKESDPSFTTLANDSKNTDLESLKTLVTTPTVTVKYGTKTDKEATLPISWAFEPASVFNIQGAEYKLNGTLTVGSNFEPYTSNYQATLNVQPVTGTLTTVVPPSVTIAKLTQTNATSHGDFKLPTSLTFNLDQSIGATTFTSLQWDRSVNELKAIPLEASLLVTLVQGDGSVPSWLTIAPLTITVNVTEKEVIPSNDIIIADTTITYGVSFTPSSTITPSGSYGVTVDSYLFKDAQNQVLAEQPKNAGTYTVVATWESGTHKGSNEATLTINPKPVIVVIADKTRFYGIANPDLTWALADGSMMAYTETNDDLLVTLTCTAVLNTPVGTDVDITGASTNTNYLVTFKGETVGTTGKLTITKSPLATLIPTISTIPTITPVPIGYQLIASLANVADTELTWQWYRAGNAIAGETGKTYTVVNADSNQLITVEAVAKETNYTGTSTISSASQIVKVTATSSKAIVLKTDSTTSGTIGVTDPGDILSISLSISPVEAATSSMTYQWKRDNVDITGATSIDYTLTNDDVDKNISFVVTLTGDFSGVFTSAPIAVGKALLQATLTLTNTGVAVGDTLTATPTAVSTSAALDTDYGFVWMRDGQVIAGSTTDTYTITTADLGKTIDAKLVAMGSTFSGEVVSTGAISIPATAPSAPTLTGYAGDKTISVNWTEPANGGSPITHYLVQKDADAPIVVVAPTKNYSFTGLTNGTKYTITVSAVNVIGTSTAASSDFTPVAPPEDPYVPPTPPPAPPTNTVPVVVDGVDKPVATIETTEEVDGTTQTTITTNEDLTTAIQESTTQGTTVSLAFTEPATTYTSVLTAKTVEAMEEKEAILEVKTETATYTLPAVELNVQSISDQIGSEVALEDIKISVTISEPPADTVQVIQDTANANNYTLVVQPVQFQVTATYEDQEVEISKFTGYVERMIAIPDGVDPSKITTAVVLNEDGTFSHVPTVIVEIEGKFFAKINSLTNSTYTVIYNEKTFADTQGHWAEEEIIDMGSRLIVSGTGNDNYEPDREITRAEFATIVVRALGLRAGSGTSQFPDVTNNSWYAGFIQTAVEYGLINGYETGNFGPNDAITREQAMTIIARAMNQTKLNTSFSSDQIALTLEAFTDGSTTAEYAKAAITACIQNGIISGRTATTIEPKAMISRAEVAVIVRRLLVNSNLI